MSNGRRNLSVDPALPATMKEIETLKVIDDWLEDKLAARKMVLRYVEDASEYSMLAGALRAEAQAAGYNPNALVKACGGDICSYLMQVTQHADTPVAAE